MAMAAESEGPPSPCRKVLHLRPWAHNLQGSTLLFLSIKAAVECTLLVLCVSSFADQQFQLAHQDNFPADSIPFHGKRRALCHVMNMWPEGTVGCSELLAYLGMAQAF